MKKILVAAVVVALALPALGWAGMPKAGKHEGKVTFSVDPKLNGQSLTADVKTEGSNTIATVSYAGGKEIWTWNDKMLDQKEVDNTGKVLQEYKATFANGKYEVNCKDKAKNECDAGIDARNYWVINTAPDGAWTYEVFGIAKDKKSDATVKAEKRHTFSFKTATAASATTSTTTPATQQKTK
jgi:hypothetical protein